MEETSPVLDLKTEETERNFLNRLINFRQKFIAPRHLQAELNALHTQEYGAGYNPFGKAAAQFMIKNCEEMYKKENAGLWDERTCLTHVFIDIIHETQMLMAFFSPERGLQIAQQRVPYILKQLCIYYRFLNNANPREEFLDELHKFIFHAICFNYQKNIVLERDKKSLLEKGYRLQVFMAFKYHLAHNREHYDDILSRLDGIPRDEKQNALAQFVPHHSHILETFRINTCDKPATFKDVYVKVITYLILASLFLLAVYLYKNDWVILSLPLGIASFAWAKIPFSTFNRRRFTPDHETTYSAEALKNLATLENTTGFEEEAQRIRLQFDAAQKNLDPKARAKKQGKIRILGDTAEVSLNKKLNALLEANRLFVIHSYGLKKTRKNPAPTEKSGDIEANPVVVSLENVEDTRIVCCTFPDNDNPDADAYDVRSLNRCYRPRRQRELPSSKKLSESSHAKIQEALYELDADLQSTACVVVEGPSKMIFDLSIHFGELSPANQAKFLEGQFRVVAQTGQFNGFKSLKSGGYELKLPSSNVTENKHLRFFFDHEGHKDVKSSDGTIYKVPYYRATATGGK